MFGTEVEEWYVSGRRLFRLYTEQEKPEPVENKGIVKNNFMIILCLEQI